MNIFDAQARKVAKNANLQNKSHYVGNANAMK